MTEHPAITVEELMAQSGWVRRLVQGLVDADDAVQDVLLTALEHRPDRRGSLRGWLGAVVANGLRMRRRGERRRLARERAAAEALEGTGRTPEEIVAGLELQRRIASLLVGLAEPYRQAIFMRFFDDLPPIEIARCLGLPPGTLRWRLKEGLDQLRAQLHASDPQGRSTWRMLAPFAPALESGKPVAGGLIGVLAAAPPAIKVAIAVAAVSVATAGRVVVTKRAPPGKHASAAASGPARTAARPPAAALPATASATMASLPQRKPASGPRPAAKRARPVVPVAVAIEPAPTSLGLSPPPLKMALSPRAISASPPADAARVPAASPPDPPRPIYSAAPSSPIRKPNLPRRYVQRDLADLRRALRVIEGETVTTAGVSPAFAENITGPVRRLVDERGVPELFPVAIYYAIVREAYLKHEKQVAAGNLLRMHEDGSIAKYRNLPATLSNRLGPGGVSAEKIAVSSPPSPPAAIPAAPKTIGTDDAPAPLSPAEHPEVLSLPPRSPVPKPDLPREYMARDRADLHRALRMIETEVVSVGGVSRDFAEGITGPLERLLTEKGVLELYPVAIYYALVREAYLRHGNRATAQNLANMHVIGLISKYKNLPAASGSTRLGEGGVLPADPELAFAKLASVKSPIPRPRLPAMYIALDIADIQRVLGLVEKQASSTGGVKPVLADGITKPLAELLVERGISEVYPTALYYVIVRETAFGHAKLDVAATLVKMHLDGTILAYKDLPSSFVTGRIQPAR